MKIGVIGGGIGGLSAALCLTKVGFEVDVYEQARELREVGAGLQISPNDPGDISEALAAFDGWHPQLTGILGAVDETFTWALHGRAPLERWSAGRVTLLGDACHPMLPFMAQGAVQAIEDGAALATLLSTTDDIPTALRRYEELRKPRTARVQTLSRENKTRFHLPDGPEQRQRDELMATGATDFSPKAVAWLYGHDARVV